MKVLIAVDGSDSASRAVREAMQNCNKETDEFILMHIASSWDYLNDEKNNGRLALDVQRAVVENWGYRCLVVQKVAEQSPQIDFCTEAEEREVDVFYIGESSFISVSNDDNYIYWAFSAMKRVIVGTMAQYVAANAKCRVIVVPDPVEVEPEVPEMVAVDAGHNNPALHEVELEKTASMLTSSSNSLLGRVSRANSYKGQHQIVPGLTVSTISDDESTSDSDPNGDRDVVPFVPSKHMMTDVELDEDPELQQSRPVAPPPQASSSSLSSSRRNSVTL